MPSVTARINQIKQPRGGFVKPSEFDVIQLNDGVVLNAEENVHASITGMVVDYLTRFINGTKVDEAFGISLRGADNAEMFGPKGSKKVALQLLSNIKGLDDASVINACKLVTFDVWFRNLPAAMMAKGYKETNPDKYTIQNIQTLVKRSLSFFEKYGPVTSDGFTFEPVDGNMKDYDKLVETGKGVFGGYTGTVSSGDGDFLTEDTMWDFKVTVSEPTNKHTLQLLMYWIMGLHSGQEKYKSIRKLGIFNPRLNKVYLFDLSKVSKEMIEVIENEIICY